MAARSIHWWTSPACARALEFLECRGEAPPDAIAAVIHVAPHYCYNQVMPALLEAGRVHVSGRIRNGGGQGTPIYALGPGENVVLLAEPNAARMRRRRREMGAALGVSLASKVLECEVRPVRDGRRVRTAGFGRVAGQVVR